MGVVDVSLPGDESPGTGTNSIPGLKATIIPWEIVKEKYKQRLKGPVLQFLPEIHISFCLCSKDYSRLSIVVHSKCLESCSFPYDMQ